MAAGFGSRLVPITLNTPKPLVRVKGKRIIDSLLDAVVSAGIEEIYLVRGYLSEQFDQLLKKYPGIVFIENSVYNETNNISSAYCARHLFANSYVFESDLLLYNPKLITKYQYSSNYLGVPTEMTEDWCFITDNAGYIKRLGLGGTDCYHMFGISYWNTEDGTRLQSDIERVYAMPGGKERYWDQVIFDYSLDHYKIAVRPCTFSDVIEIDTFNELKQIDSNYAL
jgi:CTP:phosphocholine cytidylyltransferase-like protein